MVIINNRCEVVNNRGQQLEDLILKHYLDFFLITNLAHVLNQQLVPSLQ